MLCTLHEHFCCWYLFQTHSAAATIAAVVWLLELLPRCLFASNTVPRLSRAVYGFLCQVQAVYSCVEACAGALVAVWLQIRCVCSSGHPCHATLIIAPVMESGEHVRELLMYVVD